MQEHTDPATNSIDLNGHGLIKMYEFKCLVKPMPIQEKTAGGLFIPETTKDRKHWETVECTFIANGALAFTDPKWPEVPRPGDVVYIARFCDKFKHCGADGQEYWIIQDRDILALISSDSDQ